MIIQKKRLSLFLRKTQIKELKKLAKMQGESVSEFVYRTAIGGLDINERMGKKELVDYMNKQIKKSISQLK